MIIFRLRECRLKRGLTIEQLSILSGVSMGEISQLENEIRRFPTIETYCRLAKAMKINVTSELLVYC